MTTLDPAPSGVAYEYDLLTNRLEHVCTWTWLDSSTNPATPNRIRTDYVCGHCGRIRTEYSGRAR